MGPDRVNLRKQPGPKKSVESRNSPEEEEERSKRKPGAVALVK